MRQRPSGQSGGKKSGSNNFNRNKGDRKDDTGHKPFKRGDVDSGHKNREDARDGNSKPFRPGNKPGGRPYPRREEPTGQSEDFRKSADGREGYFENRERNKKSAGDRKRPFDKGDSQRTPYKPSSRPTGEGKPERSYKDKEDEPYSGRTPFASSSPGRKKPYSGRTVSEPETKRPFKKDNVTGDRENKRPYPPRNTDEGQTNDYKPKKRFDRGTDAFSEEKKRPAPYANRESKQPANRYPKREAPARADEQEKPARGRKSDGEAKSSAHRFPKRETIARENGTFEKPAGRRKSDVVTKTSEPMPLNKFIAHSGECSRRDAAELVRQGKVKVNGELITDPGHKVAFTDKVTLSGKKLTPTKDHVYVLLNKPKGFITTTEDPEGRRTVMDLVANSGVDRLYPIGRLDRNTTGLLLLTNDGDLAQKLSHPSHEIKKIYQVSLDKAMTAADFDKVVEGVQLEDGIAHVDALSYLDEKTELGLEIHSGRNRIVRRIFEALGYVVVKLDRVMYAGLTKKNLPRSKWRFLNEQEVILLKHFKN